jgi:hypothetical protein
MTISEEKNRINNKINHKPHKINKINHKLINQSARRLFDQKNFFP